VRISSNMYTNFPMFIFFDCTVLSSSDIIVKTTKGSYVGSTQICKHWGHLSKICSQTFKEKATKCGHQQPFSIFLKRNKRDSLGSWVCQMCALSFGKPMIHANCYCVKKLLELSSVRICIVFQLPGSKSASSILFWIQIKSSFFIGSYVDLDPISGSVIF